MEGGGGKTLPEVLGLGIIIIKGVGYGGGLQVWEGLSFAHGKFEISIRHAMEMLSKQLDGVHNTGQD